MVKALPGIPEALGSIPSLVIMMVRRLAETFSPALLVQLYCCARYYVLLYCYTVLHVYFSLTDY